MNALSGLFFYSQCFSPSFLVFYLLSSSFFAFFSSFAPHSLPFLTPPSCVSPSLFLCEFFSRSVRLAWVSLPFRFLADSTLGFRTLCFGSHFFRGGFVGVCFGCGDSLACRCPFWPTTITSLFLYALLLSVAHLFFFTPLLRKTLRFCAFYRSPVGCIMPLHRYPIRICVLHPPPTALSHRPPQCCCRVSLVFALRVSLLHGSFDTLMAVPLLFAGSCPSSLFFCCCVFPSESTAFFLRTPCAHQPPAFGVCVWFLSCLSSCSTYFLVTSLFWLVFVLWGIPWLPTFLTYPLSPRYMLLIVRRFVFAPRSSLGIGRGGLMANGPPRCFSSLFLLACLWLWLLLGAVVARPLVGVPSLCFHSPVCFCYGSVALAQHLLDGVFSARRAAPVVFLAAWASVSFGGLAAAFFVAQLVVGFFRTPLCLLSILAHPLHWLNFVL